MGTFMGGSAPAMARQICDGNTMVSPVLLKRLSLDQLANLEFELDKRLRDTRGETLDLQDVSAVNARNRRVMRIEGALRVIRATAQNIRRHQKG